MKLLRALLEAASKKSEMDPSQITPGDVATYARLVKSHIKKEKITRGSVTELIHDMAEDDPKFGANPGIVGKLAAAVWSKLSESVVEEGWDNDDDEDPDVKVANDEARKRRIKMLSPKAEKALEKKLSKADKKSEDTASKKVDESVVEEGMSKQEACAKAKDISKKERCSQHVRKREDGSYYVSDWYAHDDTEASYEDGRALKEGWDNDDDEDPDVKVANDEARKRRIKMLSPRAEKALGKKLAKADTKDEDKAAKKVDESVEAISEGVEELLKKVSVGERQRYNATMKAYKKAEAAGNKEDMRDYKKDMAEQVKAMKDRHNLTESKIDVDNLTVPEIKKQFIGATKAKYPSAGNLTVRMDGKEMRAEVPGEDKCYSTLCMDSGKVTMLGESEDSSEDKGSQVKESFLASLMKDYLSE